MARLSSSATTEVRGSTTPPVVPDYEILARIGSGSYGEVWLAKSLTGAYRAIKVVRRESFEDERPFEREFEGIRRFEPLSRTHGSQLDILHVGRAPGFFFYVMELADDQVTGRQIDPAAYHPRTLKSDLRNGRLPSETCISVTIALLTALDHLHRNGLVHRDVKPSNIIFVAGVPKLADIGLVAGLDTTRSRVGTEGFAAPEGPGTVQADLYSLGKVLYEMATGKDRQAFPDLPEDLRDFPDWQLIAELNVVISRACRMDPAQRYPSAREMLADLTLLQSGRSVVRLRRTEQRLKTVRRGAAAVSGFCVLALAAFWFQTIETRNARSLADHNRQLAEENQRWAATQHEQLLEICNAAGVRHLQNEEIGLALLWFSEVLRLLNPADADRVALHRFRLGNILRYSPRLLAALPHSGEIQAVAFSKDGRLLAAASDSGSVKLIDATSRAELFELLHAAQVTHAEFDREGRLLLTACLDGSARVWDLGLRQVRHLLRHDSAVRYATFNPDYSLVVTAAYDGIARVWRLSDGLPTEPSFVHSEPVLHASFSPDGTALATGTGIHGVGGEVRLWNVATGILVGEPIRLLAPAAQVEFSSDGRWLAAASGQPVFDARKSRPAVIIDARSGTVERWIEHTDRILHVTFSPDGKSFAAAATGLAGLIGRLDGSKHAILSVNHHRWVRHISFSPSGDWLATASSDSTARVWDPFTGQPLTAPLQHNGPVTRAVFSPAGGHLVTAGDDGLIRLWDISASRPVLPILRHEAPGATSARWTADGRSIVSSGSDGKVRFWDASNGRERFALQHAGYPNRLAFHPDGNRLLVSASDGRVHLWDLRIHAQVWEPIRTGSGSDAVAFAPAGARFATGSTTTNGGLARVWQTESAQPLTPPLPHAGRVNSVMFSADGKRLLTASFANEVRLWDAQTGALLLDFRGHSGPVEFAQFTHGGQKILSASRDHTVRIWDAQTGSLVGGPLKHHGPVFSALYNRDESRILTGSHDMSARQWIARSGGNWGPAMKHSAVVNRAEYSPNEQFIATAGFDRLARIWSADRNELLSMPLRHAAELSGALFSPNGGALLTYAFDGTIQVWDLPSCDWPLETIRSYAEALSGQTVDAGKPRPLTPDEIARALNRSNSPNQQSSGTLHLRR